MLKLKILSSGSVIHMKIDLLDIYFFSEQIYAPLYYCRYQFFQQLRWDVAAGRLPITFNSLAELGALVVQCKY